MAIPTLYWMLECRRCGARRVVYDCYEEFVGGKDAAFPGGGYGGLSLPDRYKCLRGCWGPMRAIAWVFSPDDDTMWLADLHQRQQMNKEQREEWVRLIQEQAELGFWARIVYQRNRPTRFVLRAFTIATMLGMAAVIAVVIARRSGQ
jgi:hypothetical protein